MVTGGKPIRESAQVSIVSNNAETLDGLHEYLAKAGVSCHTMRAIRELSKTPEGTAGSAVIFPDDFADVDVIAFLKALRRERPKLLAVLVTREPQRYRAVLEPDGRSVSPLVMPRPSFGWEILDAIRAHAEALQR
jgi:DNA-binding NtrC family response regulator